jgi:hypothetical protein
MNGKVNFGRISRRARAKTQGGFLWVLLLCLLAAAMPVQASLVAVPNLASAGSFGLIGATISNTGTSVVNGDVGATTTITGFPPGTAPCCTIYTFPSNPTVTAAYSDFVDAFDAAVLLPSTATEIDLTMSRTFFSDNVYTFTSEVVGDIVSTAGITLTFDGPDPFIIRVTRDLTVNGDITFNLQNGALAKNIYWIIGRTATFNPTATPLVWDGNVLAGTSFTMSGNGGLLAGTVNGCVFAKTANTLAGGSNIGNCGVNSGAVPEPGSVGLMGIGLLLLLVGLRWRKRVA